MELTLREIRELLIEANDDCPYEIGESYFIRTVTHHYTGRLIKVYKNELVFKEAAWIADDGRFHDALKTGEFNEVEPFVNDVILGRGAILDATKFHHKLPLSQK